MAALERAASLVWDAVGEAHLVGDHDQAERLDSLARLLEMESKYHRGVDVAGLARVGRRQHLGRSLGWIVRHDPAVRALRLVRGLSVPDVHVVAVERRVREALVVVA